MTHYCFRCGYTYGVHLFGCRRRRRRRRESLFRRRVSRGGQVFIGIFQPVVFHLNKRNRATRNVCTLIYACNNGNFIPMLIIVNVDRE